MRLPQIMITTTPSTPVRTDTFRSVIAGRAIVQEVNLPFSEQQSEVEPYWRQLETADALFVRTGLIPAALLQRCRNLRAIVLHGAGMDQVDVKAAEQLGIKVLNLPGVNANAVAELTIGLILACLRQIVTSDRLLRSLGWDASRRLGSELRGRTVGLVGFGQIGRRVAALLAPFGGRLLVASRRQPTSCDIDYEWVSLASLLSVSDVVSIHVPLAEDTYHLIDEKNLALMQPGSILVNTARGAIVDHEALCSALVSGQLAAAALDVFDPEPLSVDDKLLQMDNVILTPHLGGSTHECLAELAQRGAEAIAQLLAL